MTTLSVSPALSRQDSASNPVPRPSPGNSIVWLIGERSLKAVGGVGIGIAIARLLGPDDYGRYGAAIGLATLAKELVMLGIDRLIRRDLARHPEKTGALVGTSVTVAMGVAFFVAFMLSALALTTIADPLTRRLTLVVVWMALPQAFFSAELWFESTCNTRPLVWARNLVWGASIIARGCMVWRGNSVFSFAVFALVEWAVTYAVVWTLFKKLSHPIQLSFSREQAAGWAREGWPALVMVVIGATADRIMVVLVQHLATSQEAGYLNAALRITEIWWSLSAIVASILLPRLVTILRDHEEDFPAASQTYADLSFLIGLAAALGVSLLAPVLIPLLFGPVYAPSALVLVILFWAGPAIYPGVARSQLFVLHRRLHFDLPMVLSIATSLLALVFLLVPRYGAIGAAVAMCASQWIGIYGVALLFPSLRLASHSQWRAFSAPLRLPRVLAGIPLLIRSAPAAAESADDSTDK